jgi:hypothetical protein
VRPRFRALVALLATLAAVVAFASPHLSVALQGLPMRYVHRLQAEDGEAGGAPAATATVTARKSHPAAPAKHLEPPPAPKDTLDPRPAAPDSAEAATATNENIAVTVQVQNLDTGPAFFFLAQNYPNPCKSSTVIRYGVGRTAHFKVEIYSITGQKIATLADREHAPGQYTVTWNLTDRSGNRVPPGIYFYRGAGGWYEQNRKLIVQ